MDKKRADSSDVEMKDAPIDPCQVVDLTDCVVAWEGIRIYLDVERDDYGICGGEWTIDMKMGDDGVSRGKA